eukprot:4487965-Karenia_brevis.AAC.1
MQQKTEFLAEQQFAPPVSTRITMMLIHIYHAMWKGSKEARIKAMIAEAKVDEIQAILKFAETIPELAPIPEWPGMTPPILKRREAGVLRVRSA